LSLTNSTASTSALAKFFVLIVMLLIGLRSVLPKEQSKILNFQHVALTVPFPFLLFSMPLHFCNIFCNKHLKVSDSVHILWSNDKSVKILDYTFEIITMLCPFHLLVVTLIAVSPVNRASIRFASEGNSSIESVPYFPIMGSLPSSLKSIFMIPIWRTRLISEWRIIMNISTNQSCLLCSVCCMISIILTLKSFLLRVKEYDEMKTYL
jgi:hypothetical protein